MKLTCKYAAIRNIRDRLQLPCLQVLYLGRQCYLKILLLEFAGQGSIMKASCFSFLCPTS